MAHYAFLDENNIVTEVITGKDENETIGGLTPETFYGAIRDQVCKRTSYNNNIRFNYAGIGYSYDPDADAFIAPRPTCGHKELFLNDKYQWNCQGCELEQKKLLDGD